MSHAPDSLGGLSPLQRAAFALKEMRTRLDAAELARSEPIAIIGMGCRFPGGASTPQKYWELLRDGIDAIVEVPRSRWSIDEYYDPDPTAARKTYVREGGFLREPMDAFDARFFGIVPREAAGMDPQQRLLLEVSWEALEHAGIAPLRLAGSSVGVYIGVITADFGMVHPFDRLDPQDVPYVSTGSATSFPAGRISYVLGLQGPCMVIATACSSALVSTHLAIQALRNGECDMALAGGVNLMFSPDIGVALSRMRALAPDGRSKAFDAAADGYGRGEGCGVVVLKRLSDATRDGDRIWAVLKGSAVNHDGASGGLSVPNGPAQEAVLRKALHEAGVAPHEVDYVEAHGTGTALGDPIEANALDTVMRVGRGASSPLLVGSVKTNIGHLESAAGVAGLIKVVLALHHQSIPPSLHFNQPNPHIDWNRTCISVPVTSVPWIVGQRRRHAGVSSFGLSGINAHLVVGEAPPQPDPPPLEDQPACRIITLSARTESALRELARSYRDALESSLENEPLAGICGTATEGRSHFDFRAFAIAVDKAELTTALDDLAAGRESRACRQSKVRDGQSPRIAFLFTGQGSQYVGMGRQLYETHAQFREIIDRCDSALLPTLGSSLRSILFDGPEDLLEQTGCAQPALFAISVALAEVWKSWGVVPSAVMGHSVGEYAAACVAGVFSLEDGLRLIAERGRLMHALPRDGTMAAVFAEPARTREILRPFVPDVGIAAINGPAETVISGERGVMESALAAMEKLNIRSRGLRVSHAFHSRLMEPMVEEFREFARGIRHSAPNLELISNLDGEEIDGPRIGADYWCDHIRMPVQFAHGMAALAKKGFDVYVEIGPQPVLIGLGARCLPAETSAWLPSLRRGRDDWRVLLASLGELYLKGCPIDWRRVNGRHRRVVLPTYPFQRQRHWVDLLPAPEASNPRKSAGHPLLGVRIESAAKIAQFETHVSATTPSYLQDHRLFGVPVVPGATFVEMALAAGAALTGGARLAIEELVFLRTLQLPRDHSQTLQTIVSPNGRNSWEIEIFCRAESRTSSGEQWELLAKGKLRRASRPPDGIPDAPEVPQMQNLVPVPIEGFYRELREHGLEYGPSFQALRRIEAADGEVMAQIRLPDDLAGSARSYRLHPVILDAALQALGATLAVADRRQAYLPVALEGIRCYEPAGSEVHLHARLHASSNAGSGILSAGLRLMTPTGNAIAEIDSVRFTRVSRQSLDRAADALREWMYDVEWKPRAIASHDESRPRHWLILAGNSNLGVELGNRLRASGDSCELLSGISDLTNVISSPSVPRADGLIDLSNIGEFDEAGPDDVAQQNAIRLLHLAQTLSKLNVDAVPQLTVVTRGASPVRDVTIGIHGLSQSPLASMARAITHELPELRCRTIDLDVSDRDGEAALLVEELIAADRENHVAFRGGQRLVARLVRCGLQPAGRFEFDEQATYLITGGLGALGLHVARWMVDRGARRIVLIGRRAPAAQAAEKIHALHEFGAEIQVAQADVSKREDCTRVLADIASSGYALRGVVHAAGVLDDGIVLKQTPERLIRVMDPKVRGAWLLHELTKSMPLDFFVLFSSAASMMGKPGQLNYVAANAFLDGLAFYRQSFGLPGLSVAWGAWQGIGAGAAVKQDPAVGAITADQGVQLLEAAIARNLTHVGILPVDWQSLSSKLTSPFFSEVAGGQLQSIPEFRLEIESLSQQKREATLLAHVCKQVCEVSGLAERDFDPQQGFFSLGLDSLMSVDLRNRLQSTLGCSLPATIAFQYSSAQALAAYLAQMIAPAAPDHNMDAIALDDSGLPEGDEIGALLNTVGAMSDEEAAAALVQASDRGVIE